MRKYHFSFITLFLCSFLLFPQTQNNSNKNEESVLDGIWQGVDRLILFNENESNLEGSIKSNKSTFDFSVVLRVFYGWYYDRAAENEKFSEIKTRDKNDTESRPPEDISIKCRTIFENESKNAGVYELELIYPAAVYSTGKVARNESVFVPIAVIDGKMYLDFLTKQSENFWACSSNADGITISKPRIKDEVLSYYTVKMKNEKNEDEETFYQIRYWKSGMEFSDAKATFTDKENSFEVSKFLQIGKELYQCTTGRSSKIRNVKKSHSMLKETVFDSDNTICAFGKPYLIKIDGKNTKEDLIQIVVENNKRRKSPPKPLFPISEIDFHWKEISELEQYNPFTWNRRNIDLGK